jgi:hypothetical protein
VWSDYDNDGWPDLYVANDSTPKYLYHNNHDGTFTDLGMLTGSALSDDGNAYGSMGLDFGDYDHSGRMSAFVTNFAEQPNTLYHNRDGKEFEDVSWTAGLGRDSYPLVGWGTAFFDMNNDGWLDIFVANGHVYPQIDAVPESAPYRQPLLLYRNNRDGSFDEVSKQAGLAELRPQSRRGAAFGDIFNNGNIDVVTVNIDGPPTVLVNRAHNPNHRVLTKLIGTRSNRAAIGARVVLRTSGVPQLGEVRAGSSYLSQNDLRLHFGLGSAKTIDSIRIRWPSGREESLNNLAADAIYTIVEGKGVADSKPLPLQPSSPTPAAH